MFFSSLEEELWGQFKTQAQFCNCLEHLRKLPGNTPSRSICLLSFFCCFPSLYVSNPQTPSSARNQAFFFFNPDPLFKGERKRVLGLHTGKAGIQLLCRVPFFISYASTCVPIYLPIYLIQLSKYIVTLYSFIRRAMRNQFPGLSGILKNVPYCPIVSLTFPILSFLALLSSLSSPLLHSRQKTHKEKENMGISNNKY